MSAQADLIAFDRSVGLKGSLHAFIRLAWPHVESRALVDNWHIGLIAEHYQACLAGEIKRLAVSVPPATGKSTLTCVLFPAWAWIRRPDLRWIFGAISEDLVNRDAGRALELIRSPWYQKRWGDIVSIPEHKPAVSRFVNSARGSRVSTTPGKNITGYHAHIQVLDDLIKAQELTPVALASARSFQQDALSTRWVPGELNCRITIQQRLHCDDPIAYELGQGAVNLCLPMNYIPSRKCVTKWGRDAREVEGELISPLFNAESVKASRIEKGPIMSAAEYDQDPVPEGGAVFKRDWLKYWTKLPDKLFKILSVDAAFKGESTSDFVVLQVWGRFRTGFYLVDQTRGRLNFPDTGAAIVTMARRHKVMAVAIEDKANGPGLISILKKEIPGVVGVNPKMSKYARASAISGFFESGNVFFPDPVVPGNEWVTLDLEPEILKFPRGRNDDQVDCLTQGIQYLHERTSYLTQAMQTVKSLNGIPGITVPSKT